MPKRWSTKSLQVIEAPSHARMGVGIFEFTDDYSVFHYSKMPDQIPGKGEALARMAAFSFGILADAGVPTHFLGLVAPNKMKIRLLRVIDPAEQPLSPGDWSRTVPLQVICRNTLPEGASIFRRLQRGSVTLSELGLSEPPTPGQKLSSPLVEFTTKLEEIDRFVTVVEATSISGLSDHQFQTVKELALRINAVVTRHAETVGLQHADSKVEFGVDDNGRIILIDTAGTPDENRLMYGGSHVTKQVLRNFYLPRGLETDVQRWAAQKRPRDTWPKPETLPPKYVSAASDMYRSLCERWTGQRLFGAPALEKVVEVIGGLEPWGTPSPTEIAQTQVTDLVVVGCQFGDEGKGRFTDVYAHNAYAVVRYQGGPHTGHTVVHEGRRFRFVQIPAGALHGTLGILGNGCVVDPGSLLREIEELRQQEVGAKLLISRTAHVIFPYHLAQDEAMERWRRVGSGLSQAGPNSGIGELGSTRRGVGPCREDKIARLGVRMIDLLDADLLRSRLQQLIPFKRDLIEKVLAVPLEEISGYQSEHWDVGQLVGTYFEYGRRLAPYLVDVSETLAAARRNAQFLVYEGAQSVGLDIEHGTYPFCSSGYSAAAGVNVGTGSPVGTKFRVFGVMKAYTSRVGLGPMPSEVQGEIADHLVQRGNEFGTVTGRRRRVGWLDLVLVRRAVNLDGVSHLCISSIDVLSGIPELKIATHYSLAGCKLDTYPDSPRDWTRLVPNYTVLPGWSDQDWKAVSRKGIKALPANARRYIDFITENLSTEVAAIGVGPSRDETIVVQSPMAVN